MMGNLLIKVLQVVLVFVISLAFFLLTAAFVPYPGISTDYLAALCFPGSDPTLGTYMLDEWLVSRLIRLVSPERLIVWTTLVSSACGALLVSLLFLAVKSGVRLSCLDLTGIRSHELARAERDTVFIMRLSGTGAVISALVALPVWAVGTRLLPGTITACVAMAFLSLAIGLRRLCAEDVLDGKLPALSRKLMMGAVFGLAVFIGTLSPAMLPVAVAGILFGGWVLILPQIEGRLSYFPWMIGGMIAGVGASIGVSTAWHTCFSAPSSLSPVLLWAQGLKGIVTTVMGMLFNFEGAAPLVFFAAATALFFGCFPRAFLRFGTPVIGQVAILALTVLGIVQWPEEFWVLLSEPAPLAVLGMVMTLLLFALLVGSWAKNWMDVHLRWPVMRTRLLILTGTGLLFGTVTVFQAVLNASAGAGLSARRALEPIRETMACLLPETATVWMDPPQNASLFLVHRYADGSPVIPIRDIDRMRDTLRFRGKSFAACCAEDPVLAEVAAIGGAPLIQYLRFSDWGSEILCGSPAASHAAQMETVAAQVAQSPFGRTVAGKRFILSLNRQAAVAYAAQAHGLPDAEAEALLRKAKTLDPENPGILLSLGALAETGYPVSSADTRAAIDILEKDPWLRAPTPEQALAFERTRGPVRSATFRAAARLRNFLENPEENVKAIVDAYRADPVCLSERERIIALLNLSEAEILASFAGREPSRAEIEAYLCFHLRTEAAQALYKQYDLLLAENDALSVLYRNRGRVSANRLHEKAYAFFSRDGYFPYAYAYVAGLLQAGDLAEAAKFVSGFTFREHLAARPCLAEELRLRVLQTLAARDPAAAVAAARDWLHTDPRQPRLWTFLLAHPADESRRADDVRASLAHYPLHPAASDAFAADLLKRHGEAAARRWIQSVARAQADAAALVEME